LDNSEDEIHKMASAFNEMLDSLEKSSKRERQFSSDVSHELRTPITVILAQSDYALQYSDTLEETKESLEVINRHAKRMTNLINQIMELSKLERQKEIEKEKINLSNIVLQLLEDYKPLLESKNLNLVYNVEKDLRIHGNKIMLERVFLNILMNAVKFTKTNIEVSLTREDKTAVLKIRDNGIGISEENKKVFYKAINQNNGIIIVNGPTGSGKSSTLYSILKYKNKEEVNISTVEDPIEYQIEGVNQVQCRNEIGLGFATILRALLRQDPDILMVGEIRDKETAEIAVKASLTGHLVFSTLHSNDSLGCINRLVNLGIDSYLLSLVLQMVVSQRLVRKLCPHCKKEDENYKEKLKSLNLTEEKYKNVKFYTSAGCEKCMGTGYIGRLPIFEIIYFDDILKDMLAQKKEIKQNFKTLLDDAMDKAKEGLTSLDEIMRQL